MFPEFAFLSRADDANRVVVLFDDAERRVQFQDAGFSNEMFRHHFARHRKVCARTKGRKLQIGQIPNWLDCEKELRLPT